MSACGLIQYLILREVNYQRCCDDNWYWPTKLLQFNSSPENTICTVFGLDLQTITCSRDRTDEHSWRQSLPTFCVCVHYYACAIVTCTLYPGKTSCFLPLFLTNISNQVANLQNARFAANFCKYMYVSVLSTVTVTKHYVLKLVLPWHCPHPLTTESRPHRDSTTSLSVRRERLSSGFSTAAVFRRSMTSVHILTHDVQLQVIALTIA